MEPFPAVWKVSTIGSVDRTLSRSQSKESISFTNLKIRFGSATTTFCPMLGHETLACHYSFTWDYVRL